ncbi:MAG: 30S ribosomal protein S17 [Candidatus Cloacimonas sp. 4484_275]|nr:MAG: 30S ribosomal protein S17 [Candidatus Cloacimonas sp. 4484_275]RLC50334.1 MAG: 30S ribosomal protein S17 [Candidatus Cloacimonadota bacterium]
MNGRKVKKVGVVVSDKMDKTIVVKVERQFKHPLYKKIVRRHKKFKAHDEKNECRIGDTVQIQESRPLSKDKRWVLSKIIERRK